MLRAAQLVLPLALAMFVLVVPRALAEAPPPPAWFAGCWEEARSSGEAYREVWLGPERGVLVGASLSPGPDGAIGWEHLWIGPVDGRLAYVATPSGQERTVFPATTVDADHAVFELPEHDFPQRIAYTRTKAGIDVRVEARAEDGWDGFSLSLRACEPARGRRPRASRALPHEERD